MAPTDIFNLEKVGVDRSNGVYIKDRIEVNMETSLHIIVDSGIEGEIKKMCVTTRT